MQGVAELDVRLDVPGRLHERQGAHTPAGREAEDEQRVVRRRRTHDLPQRLFTSAMQLDSSGQAR